MKTVKKSMAKAPVKKAVSAAPMMKKGGVMKKAKAGGSFGMLSVKAGIDKNPNPTAADRIAGAKMNSGKAKSGAKLKSKTCMKCGGKMY